MDEIKYPVFLTEDQIEYMIREAEKMESMWNEFYLDYDVIEILREAKKHIESDRRSRSHRPGKVWTEGKFLGC